MRETRGLVESTRWQVVRAPASPLAPRRCRHAQMTRARRSIKRGASSPSRRNSLSCRHHTPRPQPDPLSQCYTNILYDVLFGFCSDSSQSRPFFVLTFLTLCASCGISFNQMVVYRPGTKFIPSLQTDFLQQLFPPSSSHIFSCLAKASLCPFVASCRTSDVFEKVKRSLTILWIWLVLSVGVCFLCTCVYWPIQIPLRPVGVTCRHGFFPSRCRRSCVLRSVFFFILVIASVHPSRSSVAQGKEPNPFRTHRFHHQETWHYTGLQLEWRYVELAWSWSDGWCVNHCC